MTTSSWTLPEQSGNAEHYKLDDGDTDEEQQTKDDIKVIPLVEGLNAPKHPPPSQAPNLMGMVAGTSRRPKEDEELRRRNAEGLTQILLGIDKRNQPGSSGSSLLGNHYPWWDRGNEGPHGSYHLRTRLSEGRVGLLVDPGAHDNLIGQRTADAMATQLQTDPQIRQLTRGLSVEGVGRMSQDTSKATRISIGMKTSEGEILGGSYTAPVIADSDLPPLLGNKALRRSRALLDCATGKLVLPGPGGVALTPSPGTKVFDLELSDSGHFILPLHQKKNVDQEVGLAKEQRYDFQMACRQCASSSTSGGGKPKSC